MPRHKPHHEQGLLPDILIGQIILNESTPGEALGTGGAVYPWSGKVSHLTAGIEKEALIFWASFFGSSTSGMAISSSHQWGFPSGRLANPAKFPCF